MSAVLGLTGFLLHLSAGTLGGWAWTIPADKLSDPSQELFEAHDSDLVPVAGYILNANNNYYFVGDTKQLNEFSERCRKKFLGEDSSCPAVTGEFVIHGGAGRVKLPGKPSAGQADWKLETMWLDSQAGDQHTMNFRVRIHVWLSPRVKLSDLQVPDGFQLSSGGEIEEFIRQQATADKS